jgi:iron-sulfur cluster repair protein YtfE (RIC family)
MTPNEVRERIVSEHVQLHVLFAEVKQACREAADVRKAILRLVRAVESHLAMEDRLLIPALLQCDGWGSVRAERVGAEHLQQREQLASLRQLAKHGLETQAAGAALGLIASLMDDMEAEERDLLGPDLLRDDVIAISQCAG